MTIEELASDASALDYAREFVRAAFAGIVPEDRFEAYAKPVADLLDMYTKSRLSLIAAELAGVARERARQWDASKNEYSDYRSIEADTIALAIEAHTRKMWEA